MHNLPKTAQKISILVRRSDDRHVIPDNRNMKPNAGSLNVDEFIRFEQTKIVFWPFVCLVLTTRKTPDIHIHLPPPVALVEEHSIDYSDIDVSDYQRLRQRCYPDTKRVLHV